MRKNGGKLTGGDLNPIVLYILMIVTAGVKILWIYVEKLFWTCQGSPLPTLLDDDMASLIDFGVGNGSTILVEEEC